MSKKLLCILLILSIFLSACSSKPKKEEMVVEDTPVEEHINTYLEIVRNNATYKFNQSISTILFLGVDGDQGDYMSGQSDFMALAVFNKEDEKIDLVSIPRDTMVTVEDFDDDGNYKGEFVGQITLAYPYGGSAPSACARNAVNATSRMLNMVPVDHYITIPLSSLSDLVDVFGEMDIVLEDDSLAHISDKYVAGNVFHLDKSTIETYLRARDCDQDYSAIYRMKRQQVYLNLVLKEMTKIFDGSSTTSITKLLSLLEDCNSNLTTAQIERFMDYFKKYEANGVGFKTIPGSQKTTSRFEEYHIDSEALDQMILELFYK